MSEEAEGCVGAVAILFAAVIVLCLVYLLLNALVAAGALYGAGISLRNYGLALRRNVKMERAVS